MSKNTTPNGVTEEAVMAALSTVIEPELHRDLVSLNMIRDLTIEGNDVTFTIVLTTPACPLKGKMEGDSRAALASVPNIGTITVNWDANVPTNQRINDQIGKHFRNTIAISSGKGGVGKSTLSVNIAIALAQQGARVGLLDADILGPNVPIMMGNAKMPPPKARKLMPAEAHGIKYMSMAFLVKPDQALVWRGPMLHTAIRQLLTDVEWGELDYLIIDLPPGTGDAQLSLAKMVPLSGAVVVTQPMQVAAADARRGVRMFQQLDVPIAGIVENMSGEFFGTGAGEALANDIGVDYFGTVPLDANIRRGGDSGEPVVVTHPNTPSAEALRTISQKIAAKISVLTIQKQGNFIPLDVLI